MPYCPECGKPVSPNAKFCRNCGASQLEESLVPAAAPVTIPKEHSACTSCGTPLDPDEKFCGNCGKPVNAPAAPPQPAPVPVPPPGRVCGSCKNPVSADTKFCGNCGQPVNALPAPPQLTPSPGRFCGSCGSPVSAETKFCGSCGASVQPGAPVSPQAVPVPPAPPAPPVPQVAPAVPAAPTEKLIGVIANAKKPKMLGAAWDTYNLVVTDRRVIMAQLTQQMMNAAITEAQAKAKAEGKGFFGVWANQLSATFQYAVRYETMPPEATLAETPGNFALENSQIAVVDLSLKDHEDSSQYNEFKMVIKSAGGKFEFRIAEDERYINILKAAYGAKVKMPFGYHKIGGVRVKFF